MTAELLLAPMATIKLVPHLHMRCEIEGCTRTRTTAQLADGGPAKRFTTCKRHRPEGGYVTQVLAEPKNAGLMPDLRS